MINVLLIIVLSAFASVLAVGALAVGMFVVSLALDFRDARRKRGNVRAVEDATGAEGVAGILACVRASMGDAARSAGRARRADTGGADTGRRDT